MTSAAQTLRFYDMAPETHMHRDVINGLSLPQKTIPPKYFYDRRGSQLFDKICETDEYYPTRTETKILADNLADICSCMDSDCVLIEPGSGSSSKVRLLLDQLEPHTYVPLDISSLHLQCAAEDLAQCYPTLNITAACVDYTAPLELPHDTGNRRRVAFFPGSSIGNFEPSEAEVFLHNMRQLVGDNGALLIGVDLKKDPNILNAAYNDQTGLTAEFNLNLLHHINRELDADFDIDNFEHKAFYNKTKGRVEMHLISNEEQFVHIDGKRFIFHPDENIHTENSYKYTVEEFQALAGRAGFTPKKVWLDDDKLFSIQYYECE